MGFVDSLRGVVRSFTGENDDDYYEYEGDRIMAAHRAMFTAA